MKQILGYYELVHSATPSSEKHVNKTCTLKLDAHLRRQGTDSTVSLKVGIFKGLVPCHTNLLGSCRRSNSTWFKTKSLF